MYNSQMSEFYSISQEDFAKPFVDIPRDFKKGDTISRANFISYAIWSFALSRGTPRGQATVMEWIKIHEGFDYLETIESFARQGAISSLSDQEKANILDAIRKIDKHYKKGIAQR